MDGCVIYDTVILLNGVVAGYELWAVEEIVGVEH